MTTTILDQLRALGVCSGDVLMVHASMRRVGGRAEALLDTLQEAVGPQGTLLMLVCSPEGPFDPDRSPAWEELGVLSEVFRQRPGVVLNRHPVARFGAWGAKSTALVEDPPLDDYYGPGSPLERLVQVGGKVLRLGADEETVTLFHHAEYCAKLSDKRRRSWSVEVLGPEGRSIVHGSCLDDNEGIGLWEGEDDYFEVLLTDYLAAGGGRCGPVGGARAELLDAADAVAFATSWLERKFRR